MQGARLFASPDTLADRVKVIVRVRPMSEYEVQKGGSKVVRTLDDGSSVRVEPSDRPPRSFTLNRSYDQGATQELLFEDCGVKSQIDMGLDGYSSLVFAFGQTGSGKTHTMIGPGGDDGVQYPRSNGNNGLLPRSIYYMFDQIEARRQQQGSAFKVKLSFLEVYNEQVRDLLNPIPLNQGNQAFGSVTATASALPVIKLHWSEDRGFFAQNSVLINCRSPSDAIAVLNEGSKNRKVSAHLMNTESSRSHGILIMDIESRMGPAGDGAIIKSSKLLFIDLAGSERIKESGAQGDSLTETRNINKSLLTLGKVISRLSKMSRARQQGSFTGKANFQHVPFRDSVLTKLLMQSFLGNSNALMICCVSPSSRNVDDTLLTLRYASQASCIETSPQAQLRSGGDPLRMEVQMLRMELSRLHQEYTMLKQLIDSGGGIPNNHHPSAHQQQPLIQHQPQPQPQPLQQNGTKLPVLTNNVSSNNLIGYSPYSSPQLSNNSTLHTPSLTSLPSITSVSPNSHYLDQPNGSISEREQNLEKLLADLSQQNLQLKGENSRLSNQLEQAKQDQTRLLSKFDTLEAVFFKQGDLNVPFDRKQVTISPPSHSSSRASPPSSPSS
eukprot:TRINITY_DN4177_c0_g1_i1.p1 TRINITY_DN4177_c0_g1~~TRINITY_DN4177_c0_g1_i1.p1  ORF type:complete len:610 (-),score=112.53 TRINITY_DN4177_c0_g1_i1:167-1996(-)